MITNLFKPSKTETPMISILLSSTLTQTYNETITTQQTHLLNINILPPVVNIILNVFYIAITLMGICGSSVVCHMFAARKIPHTAFNLLLLNLSIADLFAALFSYPYILVDLKMLRDLSPKNANVACAFTIGQTPFWIAAGVTLYTLAYISLQRYISIRYPLGGTWIKRKSSSARFIIFIWPLSVGILFPNFISFEYDRISAVCKRKWPAAFSGSVFSATTMVLGFIFPISVMLFTFFATMRRLWSKTAVATGRTSGGLQRKRKAAILLAMLILAFFICWGPFFVYWLLSRAFKTMFPVGAKGEYLRMKIIRVTILIALCNTVADPLIYGLRGEEFRKIFQNNLQHFSTLMRSISNSVSSRTSTNTDRRAIEETYPNVSVDVRIFQCRNDRETRVTLQGNLRKTEISCESDLKSETKQKEKTQEKPKLQRANGFHKVNFKSADDQQVSDSLGQSKACHSKEDHIAPPIYLLEKSIDEYIDRLELEILEELNEEIDESFEQLQHLHSQIPNKKSQVDEEIIVPILQIPGKRIDQNDTEKPRLECMKGIDREVNFLVEEQHASIAKY